MRAAFRLLLVLSLVWCALGVGEAGYAAPAEQVAASTDAPAAPEPAEPDAAAHHHCPVAPALPATASTAAPLATSAAPCPRPAAVLGSLTRAPPLQPPAA